MKCLVLSRFLFPLLPTATCASSLNATVFNTSANYVSFPIGTTVCNSAPQAREMHLNLVNYRDCIPLLNQILLDPAIGSQNQYNTDTTYQEHSYRTCSITLRSRSLDATDIFWGFQFAIAAATAVKHCAEDSAAPYGGLAFTTSHLVFFAQVQSPVDRGTISATPLDPVSAKDSRPVAGPEPAAIPTCQLSLPFYQTLSPINLPDCYLLFYHILTSPHVTRSVKLRGLSPLRYESFGTCSVQLRGHSAVSADVLRYVEILLAAVGVVQTCVAVGGWVLGGAVSVGSRGQYSVRVFNPLEGMGGERLFELE